MDTNVLARFVLRDDPAQAVAAEAVLRQPVWLADTVLLELGWVLGRKLGLDREVVAQALTTILELETIHVGDRNLLFWAVERFRSGADWADAVHLVAASAAAETFVTFDRGLAREAGGSPPLPVETLA